MYDNEVEISKHTVNMLYCKQRTNQLTWLKTTCCKCDFFTSGERKSDFTHVGRSTRDDVTHDCSAF